MVTPVSSLPSTSSAVNIQIIEPKNFPGVTDPGVINRSSYLPAQQQQQGHQGLLPQQAQYGQFPGGSNQSQLQQAYNQALAARNAAEQARNAYLGLANQLNSQAYQQNPYLNQQQPPFAQNNGPVQPWINQGANQAVNYAYPPQYYPPQYPPVMPPQGQYPWQPHPQQPPADQFNNTLSQPQQQPPVQQPQEQQQPLSPTEQLQNASLAELNQMIANPQSLQQKLDAMEWVSVKGQGDANTYGHLINTAIEQVPQDLPQQAKDDANYVRQAALWTIGMLNKAQNSQTPTNQLPGLAEIESIIRNKNEFPRVKEAAIQALRVIDRPADKQVQKILKAAAKDKDPDVRAQAKEALAGKAIPLPTQGAGAPQGQGNLSLLA